MSKLVMTSINYSHKSDERTSRYLPIKAVRWCRVERGWYFYMGDNYTLFFNISLPTLQDKLFNLNQIKFMIQAI